MKTQRQITIESITDELIYEILSRLPAKYIARCRCVSKNWYSILNRNYFTDLFLTRSCARPQLLFACRKEDHLYFFSSSHPLGLAENSLLTADYQMKIPFYTCEFMFKSRCSSLRGLILLRHNLEAGTNHPVSVICNPSTGKSMILPKLKSRRRVGVKSYLGFDPIEKQHKVLSMTWKMYGLRECDSEEHQVLTLGTRDLSWRMIECFIPHTPHPNYSHICINGVLYYSARLNVCDFKYMIVCFDVRSEKFTFIDDTNGYNSSLRCESLINYNGKLGSLKLQDGSIQLRVLEDAEKQEWSEYICEFPIRWKILIWNRTFRVIGVILNNEIVLSPSSQSVPFYIFFYNIEKNTVRRVQIQGMEALQGHLVYTFQDHIEDLKVLML